MLAAEAFFEHHKWPKLIEAAAWVGHDWDTTGIPPHRAAGDALASRTVWRHMIARGVRLWAFSRTIAWRRVVAVMREAGLFGPHAMPKGLRHGFGVTAVQSGIPLNLVQKWLGHAQLSTTAIYADAVGAEEQAMASRMWR